MKQNAGVTRLVEIEDEMLALTEHRLEDGSMIVAILSHHLREVKADVQINFGHAVEVLRGDVKIDRGAVWSIDVPAFDGIILRLVPQAAS